MSRFYLDGGPNDRLKLWHVLAVGLVVRLAMAPWLAHPFDIDRFYLNGENFLTGKVGISYYLIPYRLAFFLFLFPATWGFNAISAYAGSFSIPLSSLNPILIPPAPFTITTVPGPLFDFLLKLPLIASDTLVALLLYRVIKDAATTQTAAHVAALWYLNPLVIWVSSGWGMWDTLPVLFTVITLALALEGRFTLAALSLFVAIALKLYPVVLLVPLSIYAWKTERIRTVGLLILTVATLAAVLFGYEFHGVMTELGSVVGGTSGESTYSSALTFWTAFTLFESVPQQALISLTIGLVSMAALYLWMLLRPVRRGLFELAAYFALSIAVVLVTFRVVEENYFVWLLPFAATFSLADAKSRPLYWAVSALALLSSVTASLLPFYLLPVSPEVQGLLVSMLSLAGPYRVAPSGSVVAGITFGKVYLAILGLAASAILVAFILRVAGQEKRELSGPGEVKVIYAVPVPVDDSSR